MMSIDVSCEIASGGGGGTCPMFAHPGLLICTSCSMTMAQGTRSASVGLCWVEMHGHRKVMTVSQRRKTGVKGMAQGQQSSNMADASARLH